MAAEDTPHGRLATAVEPTGTQYSSSKAIPSTETADIDLEESIAAGRPVGRVGVEPTT